MNINACLVLTYVLVEFAELYYSHKYFKIPNYSFINQFQKINICWGNSSDGQL